MYGCGSLFPLKLYNTEGFDINSGPTTPGTLLGERARYKLFGDTVSTASHME
jgi:hypothetical protein